MTDRLEGECDTQTPGQTTHGRPNDEGLAQGWNIVDYIYIRNSQLLVYQYIIAYVL